MKRAFKIGKENDFYKEALLVKEYDAAQLKAYLEFTKANNIDGDWYMIHGNGEINKPFSSKSQSEICLHIEDTENNEKRFGKYLCKEKDGLRKFKKNSPILKDFAKKMVDEKIVINCVRPRISEKFKSLGYGRYGVSLSHFEYLEELYVLLEHEWLEKDDNPEGFQEIPISEFYLKMEELERGV